MVPTDSKTGLPWDSTNGNIVLQAINRQVIADLRKLDEFRSQGRLSEANEWCTYILSGDKDDPSSKFLVDPDLVRLKHTGSDTRKLREKRWAEFCSEPRDQEEYTKRYRAETDGKVIVDKIESGSELEHAIKQMYEPVAPGPAEQPDVRKKGGWPKGKPRGPKPEAEPVAHG